MTTAVLPPLVQLYQRAGLNRWWWRCRACATRQARETTRAAAERSMQLHQQTQRHERNARRLGARRLD